MTAAFELTKEVAEAGGLTGFTMAGIDGQSVDVLAMLNGAEHGPDGKIVTDDPIIATALAAHPHFKNAAVGDYQPSVEDQRAVRASALDRLNTDELKQHAETYGYDVEGVTAKGDLIQRIVVQEHPGEQPAPVAEPATPPNPAPRATNTRKEG